MSKENSILKVTKDIIESEEKKTEPFFLSAGLEEMASFVRSTSVRIREEQPDLFEFIRDPSKYIKIHEPLTYGLGTAFAYNILSQSLSEDQKSTKIPSDVFPTIYSHLLKSLETEEGIGPERLGFNIEWAIEKLEKDSPEFAEWLGSMIEGIEGLDRKSDFIIGVIFVTIPFYMQEETRRLNNSLSDRLSKENN